MARDDTLSNETPGRSLLVAHCSDIHLDGDHSPAAHYRESFDRLLGEMLGEAPDLLVIAGDLFDTNAASDTTVVWAMERLASLPVPVAMIPGNHDCLADDGIYHRFDFQTLANVEMFTDPAGELRIFEHLRLAVWGKAMIDHTPEHRPLAGCPPQPEATDWYLGLAHGIYVPAGASSGRSSPIGHEEIEASPCHYLALGHHHAALEIHAPGTLAAFCGSPTDRIGGEATYALLELNPDAPPSLSIRERPEPNR